MFIYCHNKITCINVNNWYVSPSLYFIGQKCSIAIVLLTIHHINPLLRSVPCMARLTKILILI